MFLHPALMLAQSRERQHELVAEADRHRLLTAARRLRRAGGAGHEGSAGGAGGMARLRSAGRDGPDGTLAACGPRATAQVT